jgi:exopolyphosphatase/guanosine-5'-triphosphate,3'-diphosphate pyrophosphatase
VARLGPVTNENKPKRREILDPSIGLDVDYPLRVACVDMGSNAIRFLAAEFTSESEYVALDSERAPVRLGHGVYLSGRLEAGAMDGAVAALAGFRRKMDSLGIEHYRAVATSAVRESTNKKEFIARVLDESGLRLEAISGSEEARLVHLAVARHVPLGNRMWLLADLGGGSVEVSLVDQNGTYWSESHTMGSVRLLEELTEAGAEPGRFRRLLAEYISVLKVPDMPEETQLAGYVATGGNIETLAKLGGFPDELSVSHLPVDTLRTIIEQLARLSYRERVDQLGLREDRADVILPAAMVYERLADLAGADEILVPHVGIKEGVLYDLASQLVGHRDHEDRQEREVLASALTAGRKYHFDRDHAMLVSKLSLRLFDQLRSLHGLGAADRRILQAAALLHDIGQFVSFKGHHKHSQYLISHTELPNFSDDEMRLVANVARYHRKALPAEHHPDFMALAESDRIRVTRLASLLRVADALDREHVQRVTDLTARLGDYELTLWLDGTAGLLMEGWSLKKKANLFHKHFGRKVKLRFLREGQDVEV